MTRRTQFLQEAGWAAASAALASISAAWVLQLWRATLNAPLAVYFGDATFYYASVKGVSQYGWYGTNPSLGAPFGETNYDFPNFVGDALNLLIAKALAVLSSSAVTGVNLFILLGFPLAALTAYLVMRRFDLSRPVALVCAALFSLTPFHFLRLPAHIFLASFFGIPLGAYLLLSVLAGRPLFKARVEEPWWQRWLTPKSGSTLVLALIVGSTGLYYAVFTSLLILTSGLVVSLTRKRASHLAAPLVVTATIGLVMLTTNVSTIRYRMEHGPNPVVNRHSWESELYGLKLAQLVLPIAGHRVPALADLRARYEVNPVISPALTGTDPLGGIGTVGLTWLGILLLARALANRPRRVNRFEAATAVAAAMAFVLATVGGVSAVIALFNPQIRGWDRMTPFMAFFALLAVGFLLERACRHLRRQWTGGALVGGLLAVVFALALLDGSSDVFVPNYALSAAEFHADGALVHRVEGTLPAGAEILELPYVAYPAGEMVGHLDSYTELQPYLQSQHLRWSAGSMEGRSQDWLAPLAGRPVTEIVRDATAVGFSGVWIERGGYADGGVSEAEAIHRLTGAKIITGPLDRAYFLDLRRYGRKLHTTMGPTRLAALKHKTLFPPLLNQE